MEVGNDEHTSLRANHLAAILQWSKDISSDINLSSALQRLTEIATGTDQFLDAVEKIGLIFFFRNIWITEYLR